MSLLRRAPSTNNGHRRSRRIAGAVAGIVALGGLISIVSAGAAFASAPTNAVFTPGSTTANTSSAWTVGLTTSSSGALAPSNTITVTFSPGFAPASGQPVTFTGFGASCPAANDFASGNVVTVTLPAGCTLPGSTAATISIPGVMNPGAGTYAGSTFSVATSQDTTPVAATSNVTIAAPSGTTSSTTLAVSPNPTPPYGPVMLTATVSPSNATGSVTFYDNGSPITSCSKVNVASGSATCSTNYSAIGATAYVAVYSGDSSLNSSTSTTLTPTALTATRTSIMLRKGSDPYGMESRQRITVSVTTIFGAPGTITGTVKAMAGSQVLCVITLASNGGSCTLTPTELAGHHTYRIFAVYSGSTTYATSSSDNQLYRIVGG